MVTQRSAVETVGPVKRIAAAPMSDLATRLQRSLSIHATLPAVEGTRWVLSYRDLDQESASLAVLLRQRGVLPGHVVPMLMGRSPMFVVAVLALVRCGAAYAPLDLSNPPERLERMLTALPAPVALLDDAADARWLKGQQPLLVHDLPPVDVAAGDARWHDSDPDAPLYTMFTSGSTGMPKGVVIPRRGVVRLVCDTDYAGFRPHARWALMSSLAFDASTLELWAPLLNGGCCVVQERAQPGLDELADFLVERRISDAWLTSALFNTVVEDRLDALGGLQQLFTGGERVSAQHARACLSAWPRLRLINGYGPTENTTFSLCHTIVPADVADVTAGVPIGLPIRGTQACVMQSEDAAAPEGVAGELWLAGQGVALGYLDDPVLTERKFVVRDGGARWYRTGDQVRRRPEDGRYEFLGRVDRQVKLSGHRIELDEVENALAACPGVAAAAVLVTGDRADERRLVGCYTSRGHSPDEATLRQWLADRLPPPMRPHRLQRFERLPMNQNGKIDRAAVALALAQRPAADDTPHDPPHTQEEHQLAAVWQRHLGGACMGRDAHFFALGGTSLLALRMAADIGRSLGRDIDPLDLLRHPVLADQARLLADAPVLGNPGASASRQGVAPRLTRGQQSLVLASRLDGSGSAYLVHVALRLGPAPTASAVRQAFERLVLRHPMLRTAVVAQGDEVSAQVRAALPSGWWHAHGHAGAAPQDGEAWPAALLDVVHRPLALADGPMRVDWWSLADGAALCVWTVHHFAIDDTAIGHALEELDALLQAPDALPAVYGSPFAFAAVERAGTDPAAVRAQAAVVAQALGDLQVPLPMPPRAGGECPVHLPAGIESTLEGFCRRWDTSPFLPILVACGLAQQDIFGSPWRFVLTPFSRRNEPELLEPVGYLLDLRWLEAGAQPGEGLPATLARVREQLIDAQRPGFQPLDRLAEALRGAGQAQAAAALTQFAVTWRPQRQLEHRFGPGTAKLIDVPQRGARFGMTLHAGSTAEGLYAHVESVQEALDDGRAQALADAFVRRLLQVCACPFVMVARDVRPTPLPAAPEAIEPARAAWSRWLGRAPAGEQDDFMAEGGTSLLAMRLAATLRREHGLLLDVAAFLAGPPTFGRLCTLLRRSEGFAPGLVTLYGPRHFRSVTLVLGTPAAELQRHLPPGHALAVVSTGGLLRRMPESGRVEFLRQQLLQLVMDIGMPRITGIVGYSLGGLMGLHLLGGLDDPWARRVPFVLLDTHAPRHNAPGWRVHAQRWAVNLLRHPLHNTAWLLRRARERAAEAAVVQAPRSDLQDIWVALQGELSRHPVARSALSVTLLQATQFVLRSGVVRHRATNGFDPDCFRELRVVPVDCDHEDTALLERAAADHLYALPPAAPACVAPLGELLAA